MKIINVKGFVSEFSVIFPEGGEGAAEAFTGAMLDNGGPITERETRALALAFGAGIVEVLPEHELLALDLTELASVGDSAEEASVAALDRLASVNGDD